MRNEVNFEWKHTVGDRWRERDGFTEAVHNKYNIKTLFGLGLILPPPPLNNF